MWWGSTLHWHCFLNLNRTHETALSLHVAIVVDMRRVACTRSAVNAKVVVCSYQVSVEADTGTHRLAQCCQCLGWDHWQCVSSVLTCAAPCTSLYCATRHNQWPRFSYIGPVNCSDVTLEDRVTVNRGTGCNIVSAWDLISFLDNIYRISTWS